MEFTDKLNELNNVMRNLKHKYSHATFSTSLGVEDMVITDVIKRHDLPVSIFTLDTGRLPPETYDLMHKVKNHYQMDLTIYFPEASDLERFVNSHGINAFYQSIDYRKICCKIRKIGPLQRALHGKDLWVTGLRKEQSVTRTGVQEFEFDQQFNIHKCNPLLAWSMDDIWAYVKKFDVPYNTLHDQGYPSIGCAPCTRAIEPGEDERAGRWWWEDKDSKECGLHKVFAVKESA